MTDILDELCAGIASASAMERPRTPSPSTPSVAAQPFKPRRTTALDVIAQWMDCPPSEDHKIFDAIGLQRILAAFPPTWMTALEAALNRAAPSPAPATFSIPDDLSIPDQLRRETKAA